MTKKQKIVVVSSLLVFAVTLGLLITGNNKRSSYQLEIVHENSTWAYVILVNNIPVIYQDHIPAIEGNIKFKSKKSARQAGRMVLKKCKKNQDPSLTKNDLKKINTR